MSVIISNSELSSFESDAIDLFDTFSQNHQLVVVKQPIENVNINSNVYAGYGSQSSDKNVTYTMVSGIFPCMVFEPSDFKDKFFLIN